MLLLMMMTMRGCSLGGTSKPFLLTAGFPPKPLSDPTATLEAAGLKNAQVTQKEA